jgi:hypothetical protein
MTFSADPVRLPDRRLRAIDRASRVSDRAASSVSRRGLSCVSRRDASCVERSRDGPVVGRRDRGEQSRCRGWRDTMPSRSIPRAAAARWRGARLVSRSVVSRAPCLGRSLRECAERSCVACVEVCRVVARRVCRVVACRARRSIGPRRRASCVSRHCLSCVTRHRASCVSRHCLSCVSRRGSSMWRGDASRVSRLLDCLGSRDGHAARRLSWRAPALVARARVGAGHGTRHRGRAALRRLHARQRLTKAELASAARGRSAPSAAR